MAQQNRAPASCGFNQRAQRRQSRTLAHQSAFLNIAQPHSRFGKIFGTPKKLRRCRIAIAPRSARFLIISFDRLGQARMRHKADIGFINPHAERHGGHHDHIFGGNKIMLVTFADLWIQSGMIGPHGPPSFRQRFCHPVGPCARLDIDDARARICLNKIGNLRCGSGFGCNLIANVGAVKPGNNHPRLANA